MTAAATRPRSLTSYLAPDDRGARASRFYRVPAQTSGVVVTIGSMRGVAAALG
jgi:hypothetical protein